MNILLVYPEFPDTFWSFKHALKFIRKRAGAPPLGLLTVAAMLPEEWEHKDPKGVIRVRYHDAGEQGMAVEIGEPGYGDVIRLMVGIAPDKTIKGIYILDHKETPGLGARIREEKVTKTWVSMIAGLFGGSAGEGEAPGREKKKGKERKIYWFQEQYRGKALNQLTVRKDVTTPGDDYIMAITGATITSEAVTRAAIKAALIAQEIRKHKGT